MFQKLCVLTLAVLLLYAVEGKKTKKTKQPKPEDDNIPQPDVVSYSTFGFNDVGTYEGFVPSSPDYARFLTGANDESSTKQLTSSYPTSLDSTGYGNFGSQSLDGQSIALGNDGNSQTGFVQYPQNLNGFFNTPNFDTDIAQFKNAPTEDVFAKDNGEFNAPVYGTKLGSKNKYKFGNQYNQSDFVEPIISNNDKNEDKFAFNFNDAQQTFENKPTHSELTNSFQNVPTYPSTSVADFGKTAAADTRNPFKFQRVVDFTKMNHFSYPTELDTSHFPSATPKPETYDTSASAPGNNLFANIYSDNNNKQSSLSSFKEMYEHNKDDADKNSAISYTYQTRDKKNNNNNYNSNTDHKLHDTKSISENKNKLKIKHTWSGGNLNKWKDPSPVNGYEYSTNFSNMSFKYGVDEPKRPFSGGSSIDEIVPASSNIDFPKYRFPETDYSKFKKLPSYKVHEDNEFDNYPSFKEISKPSEPEFNQHKHLFSPESTASSYWGNSFKSSDISPFKNQPTIKHQFDDNANEEIVKIQPRRPSKLSYGKTYENKPSEWSQFSRRPSKNRPWNDWPKEVNKFKSEEDLLGLRNHDTSLPSYLPSYHSSNNYVSDEQDYNNLVDKWRQSYLKSKYKESLHDYESYASEAKPMHVPVPKPYPIEVPHPVIIPVPQPYPVRVPVAKPVAVPVYREITIPIEKPVPYAVYKNVPYPIEKLVPVPVVKEVAVPVVKPYPVHVPYVRPVFHHTKSRDEPLFHQTKSRDEPSFHHTKSRDEPSFHRTKSRDEPSFHHTKSRDEYDSERDEDDYFPRQESSKKQVQYRKKKPYSTRDRPRRPSRTVYQDRNRRRWPEHRRPSYEPLRRPQPSHRHRDFEPNAYDEEQEYSLYCKRTGKC